MTRKEEATNKILELIDIVKDVPKNESILAVGMDMVEWADKTMLNKVCKYLYRKLENGKVLSSQLIDNLRKEMEG